MTAADQWVWLARIRRTQGRKGEVFADILTDFPEKFKERHRLWLISEGTGAPSEGAGSGSAREVELRNHWFHKGGVVLHFAGVDSISDGEALAGQIVAVPISERASLEEDEVYVGDLIGCLLVDVASGSDLVVGPIDDVDRSFGPVPMLVVQGGNGEVLIPFARTYLRNVDLPARRVEMLLPEGLIDLNRT